MNFADSKTYLRLETHIKHSIGFIQDKVRHPFEIQDVSIVGCQKIYEPTRSSHDDLSTILHSVDLLVDG